MRTTFREGHIPSVIFKELEAGIPLKAAITLKFDCSAAFLSRAEAKHETTWKHYWFNIFSMSLC